MIIADEEHEASYKQEETPATTRDLAIWRSEYHHCPVVLGSATPSLESRARAQKCLSAVTINTACQSSGNLAYD